MPVSGAIPRRADETPVHRAALEWGRWFTYIWGNTWGPEVVLRDDGLTGDLGYPRSVARPDGRVLTAYYFNGPRDEDRTIQATLWMPPAK